MDFAKARRTMVDCQLRPNDVTDRRILAAMDSVDRHLLTPPEIAELAYLDRALPLGPHFPGRALLTPTVLARLVQAARIEAGDRVLDIACGFGASSALSAALGASVTGIEDDPDLVTAAQTALKAAGISGVDVIGASHDMGAPDRGPFDAIVVNGMFQRRPDTLLSQLAPGGTLVGVRAEAGLARAIALNWANSELSERILFDATASMLPAFRIVPSFAF